VDPEFADVIPLFIEEARDRLDRLGGLLQRMADDPEVLREARRELHTLKGSSRMLELGAMAELTHAAEEMLVAGAGDQGDLLVEAVDRLAALVEELARGEDPPPDRELVARLLSAAAERFATGEPAADEAESPASEDPRPPRTAPPVEAGETLHLRGGEAEEGEAVAGSEGTRAVTVGEVRIDAAAIDAVAEQATQMRILARASRRITDRIYDLARLAEEGIHEDKPTQVLAVLATTLRRVAVDLEGGQHRLTRAAEEQLERSLTLQVQPVRPFLRSLARHARELARSLGRQVEVVVEGEDTRLDRRIARELEEALVHLVRNAVDHGIEPPQVRERAGKSALGTILIRAGGEGSRVRLELSDDGAGIDPAKVVRQAVTAGLVDEAAVAGLSRPQIYRFLFASGFSTRRRASEISGRGVGLDAVAAAVIRVGGEIFLSSELGFGTHITLEVPVARRGEQVLVVRVGRLRLALPKRIARRVLTLDGTKVEERDGRSLYLVDGRYLPFLPLGKLYGEAASEAPLLLLGEVSGQPLALAVDAVEGEEEVLVRPLPRSAIADALLEGLALLASGEPVGVLKAAALARRDLLRDGPARRREVVRRTVRVLLVDDSLVTREMERRLLEDAGFEVTAVADAQEALSSLGEGLFDCLITDIEMPGMDGFALTEELRGIEQWRELPIVVVSTRDRPEDRLRGLKAGADAYLTKQSLDAGELVEVVRRLAGR
jgi:chemotaxis protein histidine kinase CheA